MLRRIGDGFPGALFSDRILGMPFKIKENISLAPFTTFRIGGEARYFAEAKTDDDILQALEFAQGRNLPVFVLGGGSNILVSDAGFDGLVIRIATKGITYEEKGKEVFIWAKAGEDWDEFVGYCVSNGWQGLECLSGIPGSVGGTPVQNVGAYGQEVSESISSLKAIDRREGCFKFLTNAECGFSYRKSIFNSTEKDRYIVLEVCYELKREAPPKAAYADLKKYFEGREAGLSEMREAVKKIRAEKAMLAGQRGADSQSAGSFFKNPVVSNEKLEEVKLAAGQMGLDDVPVFRLDKATVKIPAAWLIEKSGFGKGFREGNAGLSTKHSLAITNRGGASAREIISLKEKIERGVYENFGVSLNPEPILIGFD